MLKVSDNKRFLTHEDGSPFFYLGDTAWSIYQALDRDDASYYLKDRAEKGFTVIQTVAISENDGLRLPNRYGHLPFRECDPTQPVEEYFRYVDEVIEKAASLGLVVGLLPTWGDKVGPVRWGIGPEVFTPENAFKYGEYVGARYRDYPIIWILGGDRNPDNEYRRSIWRSLAKGLKRGDGGRHLMSYHPMGVSSSSMFFPDEEWMDFNMLQSGHFVWDRDNYNFLMHDYAYSPPKPCIDAEPSYEEMSVALGAGYFGAYDVRKSMYWALFAGAFGHTYGANGIFQFYDSNSPEPPNPVWKPRKTWREALQLPGASQLQHARWLLESRPFLSRIPDQSILLSFPGTGAEYTSATRADDGSYAMVYSACGQPFTMDLGKLSGETCKGYWYDPRTGVSNPAGSFPCRGAQEFVPPSTADEPDWVLVLDDNSRGFAAPGTRSI